MRFPSFSIALFAVATISPLACHHAASVTGVDAQYVEMNKNDVSFDSATDNIIHPYRDSLDKLMNVVVGTSDVEMEKENGKTETLLGNFISDLCLSRIRGVSPYAPVFPNDPHLSADICLFNNGGFRSSLPKGELTRRNIFELMPFDNELDIVTLNGKQMWNLIKFVAMSGGEPISGMRIGINPDKTPDRVVIQGQVFDSTKIYNVLTSDYLANGGDKMDFFKNPLKLTPTGIKIRDAILDYCQSETAKGNVVTSKLDGRFYYETK